jgi:hypothetical protein
MEEEGAMKINKHYNGMSNHGGKARSRDAKTLDCTPKGFYPKPGSVKHSGKRGY